MNLALAKEMYQLELERKEHLSAAVNLPAGVLVVLGGLLGAVAIGFSYENRLLTVLFSILLVVDACLFVCSLAFLIRSHVGHSYGHVPTPVELKRYFDGLVAHYRDDPKKLDTAAKEFDDMLLRRYVEAADKCANSNDRKAAFLHVANRALTIALVFALLSSVLFAIDARLKRQVQQVEIVNGSSIKVTP